MSAPLLSAEVYENLAGLNTAISLYVAKTGKSAAEVLAQKAKWLSINLYQGFKATKPPEKKIWRDAKARGWRMGRRKDAVRGISNTAWRKADELMGGNRSILARTSEFGFAPVWMGARGGITLGQNRKRSRALGSSSAVDAYANQRVLAFDPKKGKWVRRKRAIRMYSAKYVAQAMGVKILSRRAVATALEAGLRERGRGSLGVSWLHRRWREFANIGYVPKGTPGLKPGWGPSKQFGGVRRELQAVNSANKLIGTATLVAGGVAAELRFASFADGMEKPRSQSIIAGVLARETASTMDYLISREIKRLSGEVSSAVRNLQKVNTQ